MTREASAVLILAVLFVVLLVAMWWGWRRRGTRSGAVVPSVPAVPADLGEPLCPPVEATYVSSTMAGDWLDRVVAHGLGVRSAAVVRVHDAGVLIERSGAPDVFIPAASVDQVTAEPGLAGKVVGGEGLVVIRWQVDAGPPPRSLDTGLRTRRAADRPALTTAVAALRPQPTSSEENP